MNRLFLFVFSIPFVTRHRILSPMNIGSKYRTMAYFGDFIAILTIIINQNKPVKTAICCTYVVPKNNIND